MIGSSSLSNIQRLFGWVYWFLVTLSLTLFSKRGWDAPLRSKDKEKVSPEKNRWWTEKFPQQEEQKEVVFRSICRVVWVLRSFIPLLMELFHSSRIRTRVSKFARRPKKSPSSKKWSSKQDQDPKGREKVALYLTLTTMMNSFSRWTKMRLRTFTNSPITKFLLVSLSL